MLRCQGLWKASVFPYSHSKIHLPLVWWYVKLSIWKLAAFSPELFSVSEYIAVLFPASNNKKAKKNSRIATLCLKVEPFFIQWLFLYFVKYKEGCMLATILLLFQELGAIFQFHYALLQFQKHRQFCIFLFISLSFSTLCQRPWRLTQVEQHKVFLVPGLYPWTAMQAQTIIQKKQQ